MRVIEPVVAHYRRDYLGTTETFVHELIRHHERYRPAVITHRRLNADQFPGPERIHVDPGWAGERVNVALYRWVTLGIPYRRRALARALDAVRPHLLHAHFGQDGVAALRPARSRGIPLAVTFYGVDASQLPRAWRWKRVIQRLLKRATLLLAEGPHLRQKLIDLGAPADRVRLQPIPIRLDRFPYRDPRPPTEGGAVLLQASRFTEKKGVDLSIRAFAAVAGEHPAARLWLIGDGPLRSELERLARELGVAEHVRFRGMCSHKEYAALLRNAHILMQPSRTAANGDSEGGAPTVLLEAQAVGLPIVATRHADIPFVVNTDAALLGPEDDLPALAGHLRHLLAHPEEWPWRASAGRAQVVEQHDPERLGRRLEDAYDEMLDLEATPGTGAAHAPGPRSPTTGDETGGSPPVSVVLPTRDRADLLEEAVASVLEQDYPRLELVVVDDGSSDRTPELLARLAEGEPRVRVVRLDESGGAAAARNEGIRVARGRYVAFQDDDCRWAAGKLDQMIRALEEAGEGAGLAYSQMISVEVDGSERRLGGSFGHRKERGPWSLATPAVVVETKVLREVGGFDESLPRLQDLDLWVRVLERTGWIFVDEPLVRAWRATPGISTSPDALLRATKILDRKYGKGTLDPEDRAALHHVLGHALMVHEFPSRARRHFLKALRIRPTRLASALALGAAVLGRRVYLRAVGWRESVDAILADRGE